MGKRVCVCVCVCVCKQNDFSSSMMDAKVKILPEEMVPPRPFHLFTCPEHITSSANQSLALLRSCEDELQTLSSERLQCLQKNIMVGN